MKLKEKMRLQLILKGAEGWQQTDFVRKVRTHVWTVAHVKEILEDWRMRGLVQKFVVKKETSKRPVTIWRATKLIQTERL